MIKKDTMTEEQVRALRKEINKIKLALATHPKVVDAAARRKWGIR